MPYNGSGVFTRLYSWVNDAAANIKIRADRMDNEMNGMAVALSTAITKDGQTTITANLPMAGFRHTGVGNAASRTDYAAFGQVQDGKAAWVDGGGTADAITAAYSIPITTLVDGQLCYVRATAANATTTPTFSPNGLTARTIVKNGGQALAVGDIAGDGHELVLRYDLPNTHWELMNPRSQNVPFTPASAATSAYLDFAEDTDNGTNRVRVIAPASIAADVSVTLPGTADTLVGRDTTDTLTNKTLTSPLINGGTLTSVDINGATMTGKLNTLASATGAAGLNVPHGTAPSSPVNGDLWTTTAGFFARINGATQQLGGAPLAGVVAWANWTVSGTTPTLQAQANVSSIVRNGAGDYTVNFTSALADNLYVVSGSGYNSVNTRQACTVGQATAGGKTTSSYRAQTLSFGSASIALGDNAQNDIIFVR